MAPVCYGFLAVPKCALTWSLFLVAHLIGSWWAVGLESYFGLHSFLTWKAVWYWLWYLENLQPQGATPFRVPFCCLSGRGKQHPGGSSWRLPPQCVPRGCRWRTACPLLQLTETQVLHPAIPGFHQASFHSRQVGMFLPALPTSPRPPRQVWVGLKRGGLGGAFPRLAAHGLLVSRAHTPPLGLAGKEV